MRNKPDIDNLDIDDLYNNLKVYEADIKGSYGSSSNSQNVTFVSIESTSSTNELNAAYSVSIATGHKQIDQDDLEEIDLKRQVAMLSMRVKQFYKKTGRKLEFNGKEPVGFDKTKVECFNCHRRGHFAKGYKIAKNSGNRSRDVGNAGYRGRDNEEEVTEFALMDFNSNPSSSSSLNSECKKLRKANLEIVGYQYGLESIEGKLCVHQQNEVIYEEKIRALEYDVKDKSNLLKYTQKQLDEVLREKEDLKAKLEKFETSLKNLTKLLDSQISEKVKTGLGYDSQFNEKEVLDVKEEEVTETVFDNRSSDEENSIANDSVFRPTHIPAKIDFVKDVVTRSGRIPISDAKPKATASTSAAKPVNIVGPNQSVNFSKSRISTVKGNGVTAVKTLAGCVWRPRVNEIDQIFKDNRWIYTCVDYGHPRQALKNKVIVDSGCSRHMTGNKAYLVDYQEINDGGFVAFGSSRGVKREYSNARTPQQNRVAKRKNRTLIEAARTMIADSLLPITFWPEAVNTACYVLNRALVTKSHNKIPYELLNGRKPRLDFMRPFGCPVIILNTLDPLGKFKERKFLINTMSSISSTFKSSDDKAVDDKPKDDTGSKTVKEPVNKEDQAYRDELDRLMSQEKEASDAADALRKEFERGCMDQKVATKAGSTNSFNIVSNPVNVASTSGTFSAGRPSSPYPDAFIPANTLLHAMQEELLQFSLQKVWRLVDLPYGKKVIGTKWVYRNKKNERGIVVRNKARLVAQGHKQEERIDYDEVFTPVVRIEAIRIFLAFASFLGFIVYQMDVKSAFLYDTIEKEVYVSQPPGFIDPQFLNKVYKVEKALSGLHQAPRAWYEIYFTFLLQIGYKRGKIDKSSFIKKDKDDIMLVQVYVDDIIFRSTKKSLCSTPIETQKPLVKDEEAADVDVHLYRSMIRSLMYLTASRPEIMFAVCACSRFQVTPKLSHLHAVKLIFRYLKGQPKLGLWYPRDSQFDLEAYSDSVYARANLDKKSTIGGC
uniref:Retrovirus-related Pol polyprotein from transposon TNT 1-94 n=1 Tax=Tanacetum cinerariifolium TaxID=118510 RepID=A0A6L2LD19_TANCI|nr:retrovirus-related Pol polyprotein from transposon TNT 1-94 [Tanacetum cinerariifolium]